MSRLWIVLCVAIMSAAGCADSGEYNGYGSSPVYTRPAPTPDYMKGWQPPNVRRY